MEYYTSDSSESDSSTDDWNTIDFSVMAIDTESLNGALLQMSSPLRVRTMLAYQNRLIRVPPSITRFLNLQYVDISSNNLTELPETLCQCPITTLIAKDNRLTVKSFPPGFTKLNKLKELNLNANLLVQFPPEILEISSLTLLYIGGNKITEIPREIQRLQNLRILSMGGNLLTEVPATLGQLTNLTALVLSDNQLKSLPAAIANLDNLTSLLLHKNRLRTLPTEIIELKCLTELSLRDNPLVVRFVSDMMHAVPTLLELAARTIKLKEVFFRTSDLPRQLRDYLSSAHHCINPNCKGVFFDNRVEHVKFVDFCGKYRVPLLQYLCSSNCIDENEDVNFEPEMMKKVLLG